MTPPPPHHHHHPPPPPPTPHHHHHPPPPPPPPTPTPPPPPPHPPPHFSIFPIYIYCATPNFKSWIPLNNLILFWNSSYQIPKSLFSRCIMCGDSYSLTVVLFTESLCQKIKLSSHVVAVVIGTRVCSVARLPLAIVTNACFVIKIYNKTAIHINMTYREGIGHFSQTLDSLRVIPLMKMSSTPMKWLSF